MSSWMQRPTVGKGGGSGVRGREGQLVNRSTDQQVNRSTGQQVNRPTGQQRNNSTQDKTNKIQTKKNESASIFQIKRKSTYELSIGTIWGPPVGFIPLLYLFILLGGCPVGVRAPPVPQAMLTWSPCFP